MKKSKSQIGQEGMSVQGLADFLNLSYSLAYKLTNEEGFPCIRIGKRRVIPKTLLMKWIEGQAQQQED